MPRPFYLALFSNGLRSAHWSLFIPTLNSTDYQGKIIHVTSTTATGLFLEFKRNYDFTTEDQKFQIIPLADGGERYIADSVGNGAPSCDTTARDRLKSAPPYARPTRDSSSTRPLGPF